MNVSQSTVPSSVKIRHDSVATASPGSPTRRGKLGVASFTFALWVVLIDAAVETFLSGSPVRWWVAGTAVAFLCLVGVALPFRRRVGLGWSQLATASSFVVLGTIALTAWLPHGSTNGVRIFQQPTSAVFSGISMLALVIAGVMCIRTPSLPLWGRAACGLLAMYGVAAFATGIIEGTPYPDLVRGGGVWRRLPYWLQGTFVGIFVIVPLAVVIDTLGRSLEGGVAHRQAVWRRNVALLLAVGIATSSVVKSETPRPISASDDAARRMSAADAITPLHRSSEILGTTFLPIGTSDRPLEDLATRLETIWAASEGTRREMSRLTFDPKAVVSHVGREPSTLFYWVRNETFLVPYQGSLRGEVGVLMDRVGNSLDRSILLCRLLREAGRTVRLAHAVLSEAQAQHVDDNAHPYRTIERLPLVTQGLRTARKGLEAEMTAHGVDPATLRERIREVARAATQVGESATRRAASQAKLMAAAMRKYRSPEQPSARSQRLNDLREHWWVQMNDATQWVDLDPTLPQSEPGETLTQARETFPFDGETGLPAQYHHTIGIAIVIEQWRDGQLKQQPVLRHVVRPSEHFGNRIALSHNPMRGPLGSGVRDGIPTQPDLEHALMTQEEWAPVLRVGQETIIQSSFTTRGEVIETPLAPVIGGSGQTLGRGLADLLAGGRIEGSERRAPTTEGQLTAEWIEFEIRSPGRQNRTIRRQIFDVLGPGRRAAVPTLSAVGDSGALERAFSLAGETEILPVVCWLTVEFVQHLTATNFAENRQRLVGLLRRADEMGRASIVKQAAQLTPGPGKLYRLALARHEWSRFRADIYLEQPNIFAFHKRLQKSSSGNVAALEGFDIVANSVALHPNAPADAFLARLEQGVLDTNVEAFLATGCKGLQDSTIGCSPARNVAESFAATEDPEREWLTIESLDDGALGSLQASADAHVRIRQELNAGYIVMVPRDSTSGSFAGWWVIDPASGQTLGIGDRGWGQTTTEVVVWSAIVGVSFFGQAYGCGVFAPKISDVKLALCLVCAAIGAILTFIMASEILLVGVSTTALGSAVFQFESAFVCNIISGAMS